MCLATIWIILGLWSCRKNVTALALFLKMAPAPELLVFMSVALEVSFFMAQTPAPASVWFHTLIFQLSWCVSSWMENEL